MAGMDFPSSPINGQTTTDGRYYFDSSVGSSGAWRSTPLPVGGLPAGSIMAWGTNTPPANWLLADGSVVSRTVYSSLFAVIGTTYGAGDGSTTFTLPDLRGRVPVGRNGGTFGTLGATGGAETHRHNFKFALLDKNWSATGSNAAMGISGNAGVAGAFRYSTGTYQNGTNIGSTTENINANINSGSFTNQSVGRIESVGDTDLGSSLPPYQVVNYIIKASAGWTAGDSELATRLGAVETANATTNKSGLVPVIPTSVGVSGGSSSTNANGRVTFTNTAHVRLNGVFTSQFKTYKIRFVITSGSNDYISVRYMTGGTPTSASNYNGGMAYIQGTSFALAYNLQNSSYAQVGYSTTSGLYNRFDFEVFTPNDGYTSFNAQTGYANTAVWGGYAWYGTGNFDGFQLYTNTGTNISGYAMIYGYRD